MWLELTMTLPSACQSSSPESLQAQLSRYRQMGADVACRSWLNHPGHRAALSAEHIAQLYEATVRQLKLKQVIVFAEGRGTQIAYAWQQKSPARIRLQIVDSPPVADTANTRAQWQAEHLRAWLSACAASADCRNQGMVTDSMLMPLLRQLPVTTEIRDPYTLQTTTLTLHAMDVAYWLGILLTDPDRSRYLPVALHAAQQNRWQPLLGLMMARWSKAANTPNPLMYLAEQCTDYPSTAISTDNRVSADPLATWFAIQIRQYQSALCAGLTPAVKPNTEPPVVPALTPTLLLGSHAPLVTNTEAHVHGLFVPGGGAFILGQGCARDVIYRFVKTAMQQSGLPARSSLQAECLTGLPLPPVYARIPAPHD